MRSVSVRTFPALPEVVTGYELNPRRGWFGVIVPAGRTNLVLNPSFEMGTTGYTAVGSATIVRQAEQQRRGVYSLKVSPTVGGLTDGVYYTPGDLAASTAYAFSIDLLGAAGVGYVLSLQDTLGNIRGRYSFKATGRWQRAGVIARTAGSGTYRLYLTKDSHRSAVPFYTDGWQLEAGNYPTTYIDGDLRGFVTTRQDFYWNGTPHASTSTRSAQCRAGGILVNLKNLGFRLTGIIGLGLAGLINYMLPLAQGGAYYQGTNIGDREFTLVGAVAGVNLQDVQRQRQALIDMFKPDVVAPDQPIVLRYQPSDCDTPIGDEQEIVCVFKDGLSAQTDNRHQERLALSFQLYLPFAAREEGEVGAALGYQNSVASENRILQRAALGAWATMGTGANDSVFSLANGLDGLIYAGGIFSLMSGVTNTAYIARWDGTTWSALGTGGASAGVGSGVYALAVGPDGSIYAGGLFASMGGVANTVDIAKWNGSAWSALSTGANGYIYALAVSSDGTLYAGGSFTTIGGVAANYIAKWNGSAWSALGTGASGGAVRAIAVGKDGAIYVGGDFTSMGGVSNTAYIAKWNGSVWSALSTGMGSYVKALAVGPDGTLYAGGSFTTAGGGSASRAAKWNGVSWSAMGPGVNGDIFALFVGSDGLVYVSGAFTASGSLTLPDRSAVWNGSAWSALDVDTTASEYYAILVVRGVTYIGTNGNGTAIAAAVTTITNLGSAKAYPRVVLTGPGAIYQLRNNTTGKVVYFNLTLLAGESAVLDFTDPNRITFTSNWRGNILATILRGSDLDFFLAPGDNSISLFIAGTTTAATAAQLTWRNTHHSIDAAIPQRLLP